MSDVYEVGFLIDLRDDLPDEVNELLIYLAAEAESKVLNAEILERCSFQSENYSPDVLLEELDYLLEASDDNEELLGTGTGSVLTLDGRLAFRGIVHEDSWHGLWRDFLDWLSTVSFSSGVVGYCQRYREERIRLIAFEMDGVHRIGCEDRSEFEALQSEIIETLLS
jgi:hypothetical protein